MIESTLRELSIVMNKKKVLRLSLGTFFFVMYILEVRAMKEH